MSYGQNHVSETEEDFEESDCGSDAEQIGSLVDGCADGNEEWAPIRCNTAADLELACRGATRWLQASCDGVDSDSDTIDLTHETGDEEEMGSVSGPPNSGKKFRHFFGTIQLGHLDKWTKRADVVLKELVEKTAWFVLGCEVGDGDGRRHLQVCFSFKNQRTCSQVLKNARMHLEVMKGQPSAARKYCLKERHNRSFEWGEPVEDTSSQRKKASAKGGEATKKMYAWVMDKVVKGDYQSVMHEHPSVYLSHCKNFATARQLLIPEGKDLPAGEKVKAYFAYGAPGSGKSLWVRKIAEALGYDRTYTKTPETTWWQGYNGEDCVIVDDLAPNHVKGQQWELKKWAEPYAFPMQMKGGGMTIRPKCILITSNYSFDVLLSQLSPVELAAVRRRYTMYYFEPEEYKKFPANDPDGLYKRPLMDDGPTYGTYELPSVRIVRDLHGADPDAAGPASVDPEMYIPSPRAGKKKARQQDEGTAQRESPAQRARTPMPQIVRVPFVPPPVPLRRTEKIYPGTKKEDGAKKLRFERD